MSINEMLQEIRFFGPKATLDSIEIVPSAITRKRLRLLFEQAFNILIAEDWKFVNFPWPCTKRPEGWSEEHERNY